MSKRQELYAVIKKESLQQAIKDAFGKNYTNVQSADLEAFIAKYKEAKKLGKKKTEYLTKTDKLIKVLKDKHILLDSEVKYIFS